jgi:hypothetical protein
MESTAFEQDAVVENFAACAAPGSRLDSWQRAVLISIAGLIIGIMVSCLRSFSVKLLRQWGYDSPWMRKRKEYRRRVINTFQHGVNKLIHMVRSEIVDVGVLVASGKDLEIVDINNNMRAMLRWPDEFGTEKVAVFLSSVHFQITSALFSSNDLKFKFGSYATPLLTGAQVRA